MARTTRSLQLTVEEQLHAAHGVLQLVADLLELQAVASDYGDYALSSGAATALSRLCREHGTALDHLRHALPTEMLNADRPAPQRTRPQRRPPATTAADD